MARLSVLPLQPRLSVRCRPTHFSPTCGSQTDRLFVGAPRLQISVGDKKVLLAERGLREDAMLDFAGFKALLTPK